MSTQLGVRLDDNSAFGTFTTWRAAASWHLSERNRFWAGAGSAFKAPTFSQLFAESAYEVGNPALTPEQSKNTEIGFETRSEDSRLKVSVTAFWQQFRDLIQYVFAGPGQPTYVNLGGADAHGVELAFTGKVATNLTLNAHWTWLHTEVTDTGSASSLTFTQGATLIRRPASSGGGTLAYRLRGLTVAATATRIGDRDDVDFSAFPGARVTLPGYTTVDLAIDAPLVRGAHRSPGVDLTLRGENIFDAAFMQAVGFPGRARTVYAGGALRF
jgi:vitamin B12 transporter